MEPLNFNFKWNETTIPKVPSVFQTSRLQRRENQKTHSTVSMSTSSRTAQRHHLLSPSWPAAHWGCDLFPTTSSNWSVKSTTGDVYLFSQSTHINGTDTVLISKVFVCWHALPDRSRAKASSAKALYSFTLINCRRLFSKSPQTVKGRCLLLCKINLLHVLSE